MNIATIMNQRVEEIGNKILMVFEEKEITNPNTSAN